jgi:hypothetical protein
MYVKVKMISAETDPGIRGREMKESSGGCECDIFDIF